MLLRHHTEKKKTSKTSQPNLACKTFTLKKSILPPRLSCVLAMIRDLAFGPVSSQKVRTKLAPRWFSPKSRKIIVETTTICCSFFFSGGKLLKNSRTKELLFSAEGWEEEGSSVCFSFLSTLWVEAETISQLRSFPKWSFSIRLEGWGSEGWRSRNNIFILFYYISLEIASFFFRWIWEKVSSSLFARKRTNFVCFWMCLGTVAGKLCDFVAVAFWKVVFFLLSVWFRFRI